MAVLAQYDPPPEAQYGRSANELFSGLNEAQSLMERKQAMALRQQQADQQKMEFIAKLPLIEAMAQEHQVGAAAAVRNAVTATNLSTKAAAESVGANKEYLDAIQYNAQYDVEASDGTPEGDAAQAEASKEAVKQTLEGRAERLSALSAKYSYMANLKNAGYSAFLQTIDKSLADTNTRLALTLKNEELMAMANVRADAARYGASVRADATVGAAGIRADASTTNTQLRDTSREAIANTQAQSRLDVETLRGQNSAQKDANAIQFLNQRAISSDQDALDAEKAGDPVLADSLRQQAAQLRDQAKKRSIFAGETQSAPTPKGAPVARRPVAAPAGAPVGVSVSIPGSEVGTQAEPAAQEPAAPQVAPTKVPKDAVSVDIGGKTYPIYKDKNGRRAYKVDGHYVPIDTE